MTDIGSVKQLILHLNSFLLIIAEAQLMADSVSYR